MTRSSHGKGFLHQIYDSSLYSNYFDIDCRASPPDIPPRLKDPPSIVYTSYMYKFRIGSLTSKRVDAQARPVSQRLSDVAPLNVLDAQMLELILAALVCHVNGDYAYSPYAALPY